MLEKDDNMSPGIAAIKTLLMVLEKTKCKLRNFRPKADLLVTTSTKLLALCSRYGAGVSLDDSGGRGSYAQNGQTDDVGRLRDGAVLALHHASQVRRQNDGRSAGNHVEPRQDVPREAAGK